MTEHMDDLELDAEESDETPEPPVAEQTPEYWQKQTEKARREAQGLRSKLRRTEMIAKYGEEAVKRVPEDLPLKTQESLAGQFAELLTPKEPQAETEVATEDAPQVEPTPQEQRLAAVGTGPSAAGTARPTSDMSNKQILELGKSDPARAMQEIKARSRTP